MILKSKTEQSVTSKLLSWQNERANANAEASENKRIVLGVVDTAIPNLEHMRCGMLQN